MARPEKERIRLNAEQKKAMAAAIKSFFLSEREEEIGDLAAMLVLDFVTKELAPAFYNQGVADATRYIAERVEDMASLQV